MAGVKANERPGCGCPIGGPEIDGDAARLLLRQTIGIDAGDGSDESGLAVIDVSCCRDNHVNLFRLGLHRSQAMLRSALSSPANTLAKVMAVALMPPKRCPLAK